MHQTRSQAADSLIEGEIRRLEMADENKQDITVYDLAERMAQGHTVSTKAQEEVAKELLRMRDQIERAGNFAATAAAVLGWEVKRVDD